MCCTQKFALSLIKNFLTRSHWGKTALGFDQLKTPPHALMTKIRVWVCTNIFELLMLHMTLMDHYGPPRLLMSSFKPWITLLIMQLNNWPKNQLYWEKSQPWPIYSQTSQFFIHVNILNPYVSFDQVWTIIPQEIWSNLQKGKMVKIRVLTRKGQFLIFDLANSKLVWSIDFKS